MSFLRFYYVKSFVLLTVLVFAERCMLVAQYKNACIYMLVCVFLPQRQNCIYHGLSAQQSNKKDTAAALIDREEIEVSHETG